MPTYQPTEEDHIEVYEWCAKLEKRVSLINKKLKHLEQLEVVLDKQVPLINSLYEWVRDIDERVNNIEEKIKCIQKNLNS